MVNNKKKKSNPVAAAAAKPAPVAGPAAPQGPSPPAAEANLQPFSQSQFCILLFVLNGTQYLMEFYKVLSKTKNCAAYILQYVAASEDAEDQQCTEIDLLMIRAKFHSGCICLLLLLATLSLTFFNHSTLLRLIALLTTSPLVTTILSLQVTKDLISPKFLTKLGMLTTILLTVSAVTIYQSPAVAVRLKLALDIRHATILTVGIAYAWETYKIITGGVEGYLKLPEEMTQASAASVALVPYMAVDYSTMVTLSIFALFFLNGDNKKYFLLYISLIHCFYRFFFMDSMTKFLVEPEYYQQFLFGTAMFSGAAFFLPNFALIEEPKDEDEEEEAQHEKKE